MLTDNQEESKEIRKDLFKTLNVINKLSNSRVSNTRRMDPEFNNRINTDENYKIEFARGVNSNIRNTHPEYVYASNDYAITKGLLCIFKSESSSNISGINSTDEEKHAISAAKGLIKDLHRLKDNRAEIDRFKRANDNSSSMIDDYANVSNEMPDYTGGDD